MPVLKFEEAQKKVSALPETDIRNIARKNKVSVYGGVNKVINCRGLGLCGTDRVIVNPENCVSPPTRKEKLHLGDNPKMRLACQARLLDDGKVSIEPALEYGHVMKETLKIGTVVLLFGGGTLFFAIFMLFDMIGRPLF